MTRAFAASSLAFVLLVSFAALSTLSDEESAEKFRQATDYEDILAHSTSHGGGYFYWQKPFEFAKDRNLGFRHTPSVTVRHIKRNMEKIIYDARYSFDEFGRRHHPEQTLKNQKSFIVLSGCSYTYGNGLNDDQTLSYYMNSLSEEHLTYNYAIGASGTNMTLALTESDRFKQEIPLENGTMIYVYLNAHIQRTNGFMNELDWMDVTPCYEDQGDGTYKRNGILLSCSPLRTRLLKLVNGWLRGTSFHRNYPSVTTEHLEKNCQMIAQTRDAFLNHYPEGQFFVFMHPLETYGELGANMMQCLDKKKVRYLQINTHSMDLSTLRIPIDGHPNAQHNQFSAGALMDYTRRLSEWSKKTKAKD